jgi:hypothetical protein
MWIMTKNQMPESTPDKDKDKDKMLPTVKTVMAFDMSHPHDIKTAYSLGAYRAA